MVSEEKKRTILQMAKECPQEVYKIVDTFFKDQKSPCDLEILVKKLNLLFVPEDQPLILYAIELNSISTLKLLFFIKNLNINTDIKNSGMNYFNYAIELNRKEIVEFLLELGADIRKKDGEEITPLQSALCRGRTEIALILLKKMYNVSLNDPMELIKFLLDKPNEYYASYYISERREYRKFSTLLFYAFTINKTAFKIVLSASPIEHLYCKHPYYCNTLLSLIVKWGNKSMLKVAIECGADLNYILLSYQDSLIFTAIIYCPKMIPLLVKNGAKFFSKEIDYDRSTQYLERRDTIEGIETLRKVGVTCEEELSSDENEFHYFCRYTAFEYSCKPFLLALERGVDINHVNNNNECLLKSVLSDKRRPHKTNCGIEFLVSMIAKMIENKDFVHPGNVESLSNEWVIDFHQKCKKEISSLKEEKITDNVKNSYYDFLTSDLRKLTSLAKNKEMMKNFRLQKYEEKFSIYGRHLKRGFERSIWRFKKVNNIYKIFKNVTFPLLVFEQICGYLNDKELKMSAHYFQLLEKTLSKKI